MRKRRRITLLLLIDAVLISMAGFMALVLRFDGMIPYTYLTAYLRLVVFFIGIQLVCSWFFGLHRKLWEYASLQEMIAIIQAVSIAAVCNVALTVMMQEHLPRSFYILSWGLTIGLIGGSRVAWRIIRSGLPVSRQYSDGHPVLIVGAGKAGLLVGKELVRNNERKLNLVGFIDDDEMKHKEQLLGRPILGNRHDIPLLVAEYEIEEIILALPSASGSVIRDITNICADTQAKIMILPGMYEIIEGKVTINQIREVDVEDLLHRDAVCLDIEDIAKYVTMKSVLVTGAGGSIGSELCRQIARFCPKELILLGHDENPIFNIEKELAHEYPYLQMTSIIADIKDRERIRLIFNTAKPEVVFHAAAHKHVPLMEDNPVEAIKNNIFGTLNLAEAADRSGTGIFVLISTDKAVNPSNVMGTTKRVAEMIMQKMSTLSKTRFVAVRFGNVLGSDGSVIEVFKEQIKHGGPVTVTHEEMTRYFMTIPEAAQLVIQAGAMASGGEIFVLDMGEPIKIMDLARDLIRFSGFDVRDIPIEITGVRPGEKLHEKLVASDEGVDNTRHERIMVVKPEKMNAKKFEDWLLQMAHFSYAEYNQEMLINLLNAMVPFGDTAYREQAS